MMAEKVNRGILRSQYLQLCRSLNQQFGYVRHWSRLKGNLCQKEQYLKYRKDSEVAYFFINDVIENIIHNGSLEVLKNQLLSDIWEKPSVVEEKETTTTTTSTTEEVFETYDFFGKRKKREANFSHSFSSPPRWNDLKMASTFKIN